MMKQIYWQFLDEIEGVSEYVNSAVRCEEKNSSMASTYMDMAKTEVGHAEKLLTMMREIAEKKDSDKSDMDSKWGAADILIDVMSGQLVKARAMVKSFE